MGLDIYFSKRAKASEKRANEISARFEELYQLDNEEIKAHTSEIDALRNEQMSLTEEVGYFRKANFLLPFFGYTDASGVLKISKEQVEKLIDITLDVWLSNDPSYAEKALPTESGFFFGGIEYDEYYFEKVGDANITFKKILKKVDWDTEDLLMFCSW